MRCRSDNQSSGWPNSGHKSGRGRTHAEIDHAQAVDIMVIGQRRDRIAFCVENAQLLAGDQDDVRFSDAGRGRPDLNQ